MGVRRGSHIIDRMRVAVSRMRAGLNLLNKDDKSRLAFALANRAMLDQMRQHDRVEGKPRTDDAYRWRPFQLAFLLTTLESLQMKTVTSGKRSILSGFRQVAVKPKLILVSLLFRLHYDECVTLILAAEPAC